MDEAVKALEEVCSKFVKEHIPGSVTLCYMCANCYNGKEGLANIVLLDYISGKFIKGELEELNKIRGVDNLVKKD